MLKNASNLSTIVVRIKYYRLLNGLRQKDIYEKIEIDKSTYIRYESKATTNFDLESCRITKKSLIFSTENQTFSLSLKIKKPLYIFIKSVYKYKILLYYVVCGGVTMSRFAIIFWILWKVFKFT